MIRQFFRIGGLLVALPLALSVSWDTEVTRVREESPWVARVARRSFDIEVRTTGDLEAARSLSICSTLPSDLGKLIYLIPDGSAVVPGDLLAKIDPAPFDDWVADLKTKVAAQEATVEGTGQALAWERQQSELEEETVALEMRTAEMELEKVAAGDGPMEMGRLNEEFQKAGGRVDELRGYLEELQALADEGFLSEAELAHCQRELREAEEAQGQMRLKFETYLDYTLPMMMQRAETALEQQRMRQKQVERSAAHKIAQAHATFEHARKALFSLQQQLQIALRQRAATEIRAPASGMVVLAKTYHAGVMRQPQLGDLITKNQPLIELPDLSEMIVRTQVRELDLHKVTTGTPAMVSVDAYPHLKLPGRVVKIGILALADRRVSGSKAFEVVVALDEIDPRLRPGMTAQVTLHSLSVTGALAVPLHALFEIGTETICYRQTEEGFESVPVQVGPASEQWAVVTGLEEGDRICTVLSPDEL
jgi:HlyD family secretion protein